MSRRLDLCAAADVPMGTLRMVEVEGELVLVSNVGGVLRATQGVCTHEYFELDHGFLTGGSVTCALHLSRFDLDSGEPLDPPAELPLAVYPVTVESGRVFVDVPAGPLEVNR